MLVVLSPISIHSYFCLLCGEWSSLVFKKSPENKTTIKLRQCVSLIYFISYLEKTYTITAQEPSIYTIPSIFGILSVSFLLTEKNKGLVFNV